MRNFRSLSSGQLMSNLDGRLFFHNLTSNVRQSIVTQLLRISQVFRSKSMRLSSQHEHLWQETIHRWHSNHWHPEGSLLVPSLLWELRESRHLGQVVVGSSYYETNRSVIVFTEKPGHIWIVAKTLRWHTGFQEIPAHGSLTSGGLCLVVVL